MKLKTKINFIFLITGIAMTIGGVGILYYYTSFNLHVEVFNRLDTVAKAKGNHVTTYIDQAKGRMIDFGSDGLIKDCLFALNGNSEIACTSSDLSQHLSKNKLPAVSTLIEVYTTNRDGVVVASTAKDNLGLDISKKDLFTKTKDSAFVEDIGFSQALNTVVLTIAAPVYRNDNFMGVVVGVHTPDGLYNSFDDTYGLGDSGVVYIVNGNGYVLSPTKNEDDIILQTRIATKNREKCVADTEQYLKNGHVERHAEQVLVFDNHRNTKVIGAHDYIDEMNWCLLAEMNEHEALQPVQKSLIFFAIIAIMIIIIVFFIANGLASLVTRPVVKLKEGLEIIEEGHLDHRVGIEDDNEFGELSRSVDRIIGTLRSFRDERDSKDKKG